MSAAVQDATAGSSDRASNDAHPDHECMETMPFLHWSQRLKYTAMTFALQKLLLWPMETIESIKRDYLAIGVDPASRPDIIKAYPLRKGLPIRIFIPSSMTSSPTPLPASPGSSKLPILFTIHGGGFVLGSPPDNEAWNRSFANRHDTLVVALNYSKAPGSPFPTAVDDLEALVLAILSAPLCLVPRHLRPYLDPDTSRLAIAGFSAGGNLALALAQRLSPHPGIAEAVKAVIPVYPVLDFTVPLAAKIATRQYKPSLGGFRGRDTDYLVAMAPMFDWSYIPAGQDLRDPLLCPYFADETKGILGRSDVMVVGCELDILCHEAWRLANRLAGRELPGFKEKVGREAVADKGQVIVEGDGEGKFGWDDEVSTGVGDRKRRIKWLLVPDAVHGFDQDLSLLVGNDKEVIEDSKIKTEKLIGIIGGWLFNGPFKAE